LRQRGGGGACCEEPRPGRGWRAGRTPPNSPPCERCEPCSRSAAARAGHTRPHSP
jgi:hypothetical protein